MARTVKVLLIDDVDGGPATQTVKFGLDGFSYEVDLSDENAEALRLALDPFVDAARRTGGRLEKGVTRITTKTTTLLPGTSTIRAWAESQGFVVKPRGRVPQEIVDAYVAAHP